MEYEYDICQKDEQVLSIVHKMKHKSCLTSFKKLCRYLALVSLVLFVSFFTSVVTVQYYEEPLVVESGCDCVKARSDLNRDTSRFLQQKRTHRLPIPGMQVQTRPEETQTRIGAQLSANQSFLNADPPSLVWSHRGTDSFLEGINHVTHYHSNHAFDCLEITIEGRYLISIQLTYRYNFFTPTKAVKCYFTLTKFNNNTVFVIAKSDFSVPAPEDRHNDTVKQPVVMIRSGKLKRKDRVCVTVSHPHLIYASQIDNFYGIIAL